MIASPGSRSSYPHRQVGARDDTTSQRRLAARELNPVVSHDTG